MRLIHITDPHLSTLKDYRFIQLRGKRRSGYLSWLRNRRHEHRPEILEALVDTAQGFKPDLYLVSGDLVHIGLESEIAEAAEWLRALGPPDRVALVPGNHDNYAKDSLAEFRRLWTEYLPPLEDNPGDYSSGYPFDRCLGNLRVTGLNSSNVTRIFSATGKLGGAQLARLESRLGQRVTRQSGADHDEFQCLLIHHPPVPGLTIRRKALTDAEKLAELIRRQQPQLVLYGHIHCNRENSLDATRMYCTASASSHRDASFRVFDIDQDDAGWQCRMRLMTLDPKRTDTRFRLASEEHWQA